MKAFNTLFGQLLPQGGRLDAFIAADDLEAKARVLTFIESLGLRPFDVGACTWPRRSRRGCYSSAWPKTAPSPSTSS